VDNRERFAKAKKAFEDNLNHLREKEKQVPVYVVNLSMGLFELTEAIEAEIFETRKSLQRAPLTRGK
jgi:esterase/lipase superfamily enzyme